jgi:hypothetical protein
LSFSGCRAQINNCCFYPPHYTTSWYQNPIEYSLSLVNFRASVPNPVCAPVRPSACLFAIPRRQLAFGSTQSPSSGSQGRRHALCAATARRCLRHIRLAVAGSQISLMLIRSIARSRVPAPPPANLISQFGWQNRERLKGKAASKEAECPSNQISSNNFCVRGQAFLHQQKNGPDDFDSKCF